MFIRVCYATRSGRSTFTRGDGTYLEVTYRRFDRPKPRDGYPAKVYRPGLR